LGLRDRFGSSKLDILIIRLKRPKSAVALANAIILGAIHAKVSLAERVSDDMPASAALMKKGYASFLVTLDVKSFPLSPTITESRAYLNKGELGNPARPTDKRRYLEEQGRFDAAFSYNFRTIPSGRHKAKSKIFVCKLDGKPDDLYRAILSAGKRRP